MTHAFHVEIAVEYGVTKAILLEYLCFWQQKNKANRKHFYDNRYWVYNSIKAFHELFPYLSEKQIRYALKSLEKEGVIYTGNYNKNKYDRTVWYSVSKTIYQKVIPHLTKGQMDKTKSQKDKTKSTNRKEQKGEPIPVSNTSSDTVSNTSSDKKYSASTDAQHIDSSIFPPKDIEPSPQTEPEYITYKGKKLSGRKLEMFLTFWDAFDDKRSKARAADAWLKIKNLDQIFPDIIEGAKKYAEIRSDLVDRKLIPKMPEGWLKERRWEDEDIRKAVGKGKTFVELAREKYGDEYLEQEIDDEEFGPYGCV